MNLRPIEVQWVPNDFFCEIPSARFLLSALFRLKKGFLDSMERRRRLGAGKDVECWWRDDRKGSVCNGERR